MIRGSLGSQTGGQRLSISRNTLITSVLIILCGLVVVNVPTLIEQITAMGHNIDLEDVPIDYLLGIAWAITLLVGLLLLPLKKQEVAPIVAIWIARCCVTLGVMLLYENNYGLDAYGYYTESGVAPADILARGGTSVTYFIVHWTHRILPYSNSYHATKVIFSFVGLIASFVFYRGIKQVVPKAPISALYIVGLFPTVLFWSSILGKDPIQFLGLSFYFYGIMSWIKHRNLTGGLWILAGTAIATLIRAWSAPILLVPIVIFLFFRKPLWTSIVLLIAVRIGLFNPIVNFVSAKLKIETVDDLVGQTQKVSHSWDSGGSAQEVPDFTDVASAVRFLPRGMFTALFRPLPGEIMNPFGLMAGIESLFFFLWFLWAVFKLKHQLWRDDSILICLILICLWSAIYGFVSYQNLGSGYRFRLQAVPFLLFVIVKAWALPKFAVKSNE